MQTGDVAESSGRTPKRVQLLNVHCCSSRKHPVMFRKARVAVYHPAAPQGKEYKATSFTTWMYARHTSVIALHLLQALVKALDDAPKQVAEIGAATPRESLQQLKVALCGKPEERRLWAERAKIAAILGACPKSQKSLISGLRHWCEFVAVAYGNESKVSVAYILCHDRGSAFLVTLYMQAFPPRLDMVLAWSTTFRCAGTFGNYLGYLRTACLASSFEPPPQDHPGLRRAMQAIVKKQFFSSRPRLAICRTLLRNMLAHEPDKRNAALWLAAYTWLLRLPSEASYIFICISSCAKVCITISGATADSLHY